MNKQEPDWKGKSVFILQNVFICRYDHLCKKPYGLYPKKAARVSEFRRLQDIRSNTGINFIFTSSEKLEIKVYKTILQHQKNL